MIGVLVVDDSSFMRLALRRIIEAEGDLKVLGEAPDGEAALEAVRRLRPQVVAMDLEMPRLDGVEATRRIMALPDPPAVVMVSHHTTEGSAAALRSLEAGAVDFLCKESGMGGLDLGRLDRELRGRLRHWARARGLPARPAPDAPPPAPRPAPLAGAEIVAIGASTGGPDALAALLAGIGAGTRLGVPLVIAQHMPAELGPDLARHLARRSGRPVALAQPGERLRPEEAALLPGGTDGTLLRAAGGGFALRLARSEAPVHPSVDLLFRSVALIAGRAVGVVLTGMGRDGTAGAAAMAARGMAVLAQAPASCVVAGMPGAVIEAGLATEVAEPAALGRRLGLLLGAQAG